MNKKILVTFLFILFAATLIFTMVNIVSKNENPLVKTPKPIVIASPHPSPRLKTKDINSLPISKTDPSLGVDIDAPEVKESIYEILKLKAVLPFEKVITTKEGLSVTISIPPLEIQSNPWTLKAYIIGIDYQVQINDRDYATQKSSFIEASTALFDYLQKQGVDPKKIYISFGNRAYIQEKAEMWLKDEL